MVSGLRLNGRLPPDCKAKYYIIFWYINASVLHREFTKGVSGQSECTPPEGGGDAFSLSMQPVAFNPPEKGGLHLPCLGGSSGERFFHQVLIVLQCPPPRGWWHLLNPAAAVCFPRIPVNFDGGNNGKKQ